MLTVQDFTISIIFIIKKVVKGQLYLKVYTLSKICHIFF